MAVLLGGLLGVERAPQAAEASQAQERGTVAAHGLAVEPLLEAVAL